MKRIMLISLILLLFISCSAVFAENNISDEVIADTNLEEVSFNSNDDIDLELSELNDFEKSADAHNDSVLGDADEGEYVDVSEAYEYLNAFRLEENVWYWNADDTTQSHVNTNDTVWLKELQRDVELENTAKIRAKEISEYFSHYRLDGTTCFAIFPDGLLDYGENIAYGYETCFDVTEGWKETDENYYGQGHRRTMLQADFNYVGIAGYKVNGTIYWVQNFGCRDDPQDISSDTLFYFENNTISPRFAIELPSYASGRFEVYINGNLFDGKSIFNGKSDTTICGLNPGTYEVYLSYYGDYNCKPVNETSEIVIPYYENPNDTLSFNELNTLIQMADDEVKLENDYVFNADTDSSFVGGIKINKWITIDGQGHSIDARGMARIFYVFAYGVTLKNLNLINGNANASPDQHRYFDGSSIGITNYYYANLKANKNGGAIYSPFLFSIINTTFFNNYASNGGAISSISYMSIENSSFTNNSADWNGGAIYSNDYVLAINTNFTSNYAFDFGSAVYSTSPLEAINSIFENNTNLGIFVDELIDDNITIINDEYLDVFSNASADNGIVTLDRNYNAVGTVHISASNVIIDGRGYTIDAKNRSRLFYITGDNVTIKNINLVNGYSRSDGGAIYDSSYSLSILNSTFTNCISQNGGAVYGNLTNISIKDSKFTNNEVKDFSGSQITEGGAICTSNGTVFVSNSRFINNTAFYGGVIHTDLGHIYLEDSYFEDNHALIYAGGVIHCEAEVDVVRSIFRNNYAPLYGGAIFCYGEYGLYIKNSIFENNTSHHYGGAISANVLIEITDSIFTDNHATDYGGVLCMWGNLTVINSNFTNNSADVASAIFDYSESSNVLIRGSNFANNTQMTTGVIYITNNAFVEDSTFINNKAYDGVGGAIVSEQNLTVSNSTFINNSADRSWGYSVGGAIVNYGENLHVEDSFFADSNATRGGAIANFVGNAFIDGSTFINNSAVEEGGAIYSHDNTFSSVSNSVFENNSANDGGAIYSGNAVNCTFIQNQASNFASAIYGTSNTADDCKFIRNIDHMQGPTLDVATTDCTFKDNKLIIKAEFNSFNLMSAYYPGDVMMMYLHSNLDFTDISNATVTVRAYKNNNLAGEFEFLSGDGWIVNITEGNYTLSFSVENQDYEVTPVNATVTIIKKEIANVDISIDNITYSDSVVIEFKSNLDGSLYIYVDDNNLDYLYVTANIAEKLTYNYIASGNHTLKVIMTPEDYHLDSQTFTKDFTVFKKKTNITIFDPVISASDLTALYSASAVFKVTVNGTDGKLAKNTPVVFKVNGVVFASVNTDTNGVASFTVTQVPGEYTVTAEALGLNATAALSVSHVVTLKAVKVKKSAKKLVLTATLKKVNGKYLKKVKVTFKFNGKKYTAKTNKKGVAKYTIKSKVLKKLKVGKKVTYQATYGKDTVKKTEKVKK